MFFSTFRSRKVLLLATSAMTLALAAPAFGQEASDAAPSGQGAIPSGPLTLGPVRVQGQGAADATPYADPKAAYKADRLSSSKFTEPVLNTPRTETVITKGALNDANATSLRDVITSTAGVTLGSGEGGNAFGDRFFIRGFDARNDVFIDGVRDPGVLVRENFNTQQIEILKGPASSFAGRGTTGGALNVVTKQAMPGTFYDVEAQGGLSDNTKRLTLDLNQEVNSALDVRLNAMIQNADVAGRKYTIDNRRGVAGAVTWRPLDSVTVTGNYSYTDMFGLPDFGVPYNPLARRPVTSGDVPRDTYYGAINRDFTRSQQAQGALNVNWAVNDWLTLENDARQSHSLLNYIGTIPENPGATGATAPYSSSAARFSGYTQLNAQSRYEPVTVLVDQPQATLTFDTGPVRNVLVVGGEFSGEHISIAGYSGLTSELTTGATAFTSSGAPIVPVGAPTNTILTSNRPALNTNPQRYRVNTRAGYIMDTANYQDFIIFNAGIRIDDYNVTSANNTVSQRARNDITSYNAGLVIKPSENVSIYGAFATSADPVGDEVDATASAYGGLAPTQPSSQVYSPLKSKAYEVGVKWSLFDDHLLATAAAFRTDVDNARETAPAGVPGTTSGQIYANAAYRVQGFDFGLSGNITDDWSMEGGLTIMEPKITRSIVPTNVGLQLANIAPRSFNLLSKYTVFDWLAVGGQAVFSSRIEGGSLLAANGGVAYPNAPYPTMLPSYWRFDAFVEAKVTEHLLVRLNAQNLFDRTYYNALYQSAVPFVQIAPGRAVYLTAEVKL